MRRLVTVLTATAASMLMTGGIATAHECFIENRSDRGDAMAAERSPRWGVLTPEIAAVRVAEKVPSLDQACFVDYWRTHGGPEELTIRIDRTVGEGSENPNLANGKGLEFAVNAYGDLLIAAILACA